MKYKLLNISVTMTSLSYGRVFCLDSQKIDAIVQRMNDTIIILDKYYLSFTNK